MQFKRILLVLVASLLTVPLYATRLTVSVSGQFSSPAGNQAAQLWSPNAPWSLSFDVDSTPLARNTNTVGFDTPFYYFSYKLNGSSVATSPQSIRFSTSGNLGLFTLFFGSESGYLNGNPIPEFSFEGPQAFSGTTSNPTLLTGRDAVTDWIYSDAVNYDENTSPASIVSLAPAPEPATLWVFALASISLAFMRFTQPSKSGN